MGDPEAEWETHYERAAARFSPIQVPRAVYAAAMTRFPPGAVRHPEDLYLALALAGGDPSALRHFETHLVPLVSAHLSRLRLSSAVVDETMQQLRCHLFVGLRPRIHGYEGRGALLAWLRIIAARLAISSFRSARVASEPLDEAHAVAAAPRLLAFRDLDAKLLSRAVSDAIAMLSSEDAELLRLYYRDGLSTALIAALLGVHKATAARRLEQLREVLYVDVKRRLNAHVKSSTELASLVDSLFSRISILLPGGG